MTPFNARNAIPAVASRQLSEWSDFLEIRPVHMFVMSSGLTYVVHDSDSLHWAIWENYTQPPDRKVPQW